MTFSGTFSDGRTTHSVGAASDGEAGRRATLAHNPDELDAVSSIKGFAACAMQAVIVARENVQADFEKRPEAPGRYRRVQRRHARLRHSADSTAVGEDVRGQRGVCCSQRPSGRLTGFGGLRLPYPLGIRQLA